MPLTDGSAPPSWQEVEQFVNNGLLPVGDPCVVGMWVTAAGSLTVNGSNGPIQLMGGAGVNVKIRSDGSSAWDYGGSQPYGGTYNGGPIELVFTGTQVTTVHATPPQTFSETLVSYTVAYFYVINGQSQAAQAATFAAATSYSCSATTLTETAAGTSVSLVRRS